MGQLISWILLALKYGPSLVAFIREIISLIQMLSKEEQAAELMALKEAHQAWKLFKDREPLDRLHKRLKEKCAGPSCSPPV